MEFVGPLEKVLMGHLSACTESMMVPSFCVRNSGHVSPREFVACLKPRIVDRANLRIDVFRMVAFSRSRKPSWPTGKLMLGGRLVFGGG